MNKKTNIDNAKLVFEELEPRLLLSADGLGVITETSVATLQTLVHSENENIIIVQHQTEQSSTVVHNKTQADSRSELVIIDSRAPNFQQLHNDVIKAQQQGRDINVVILDAHRDGIEQISEALDKYHKLDAVHIVSHGKDAQLQLGATQLNSQNLKQHNEEINKWKQVFTDGGDLLIYGCNLAGSANGTDLVNSLSTLTGADIAASDDVTGNDILGGDWDLEYQTGDIETSIAFTDDIQDNWQGTLNADALAAQQAALAEEQQNEEIQAQAEQEAVLIAEAEAVLLAEEKEAEIITQEPEQQAGIVEEQRQEIVFFDTGVENYQTLVDDILNNSDSSRNVEVVLLNIDENGIDVISNTLQDRDDLDAIHIISHGDDGTVQLGNTSLNADTLADNNLAIALWANAFDEAGDIMIYGCNLAETEVGESLINSLSELTLTDVAASDDLTGHDSLGGDWELEYHNGEIDAGLVIGSDVQQEWTGLLDDTGYKSPTATGDDFAEWGPGANNAYSSDDVRATGVATDGQRDQDWYNFDFGVPAGATIDGIEVSIEGRDPHYDGNGLALELSWDGGATYTTTGYSTPNLGDSDSTDYLYTYGGTTDTWGRTWSDTELSDTNFRLKLSVLGGGSTDVDVDHVQVRVLYTEANSPLIADGANQLINETTLGTQKNIDIDLFADGSYVAVWDSPNDGSGEGVYLRILNADGTEKVTETLINQTTTSQQIDPRVAVSANGNFVVSWTSTHNVSEDIYARVFDSNGVALTNEFLVNTDYTTGDQFNSDVAIDDNGNFVITWQGTGAGDSYGIYSQLYSSLNTPNGSNFLVNDTITATAQIDPAIAMSGSGAFVITWTDQSTSDIRIAAQSYSAAGVGQGEFVVHATADSSQGEQESSVAMDDSGNFIVTWSQSNADGNGFGIEMQRFDASGTRLEVDDLQVNTTTSSDQADPDIDMRGNGEFVISWTSVDPDGDANGVIVQQFNADGSKAGGELVANTYTISDQHVSQVTINDAGNVVVAWEGQSATETYGVFAQRYILPNNAPVLAGANNLTTINEDPVSNNGTLVSDLITGQFTDADSGASPSEGIAVIAVDDTNGSWEYTTDGGTTWTAFGVVDTSTARLLTADASTSVRFVPDANWNGSVTNGITFHAWDQTSGTAGATVDLTSTFTVRDNFTTAAYTNNDGTATWAGNWIETNDTGGATSDNVVITGGELRLSASDGSPDEQVQRAVDLSSATSATYTFDFSTGIGVDTDDSILVEVSDDGGTTWTTLENITGIAGATAGSRSYDISAYATADTQIRFSVGALYGGADEFFYVDNLQIEYSSGLSTGGTTAFSTTTASSSITVTAVNDAPTAANNTVITNEDTTYTFSAIDFNFSDIDGDTLASIQITSLETVGALQLSGVDVTLNQVISKADIDAGNVKFVPTADSNGNNYDSFGFSVNDGTTDSVSSYTQTIEITAVNDAAVMTASAGATAYTEQASATVIDSGITLTDIDGFNNTDPSDQYTATIQVTGNYEAADILGFTDTSKITGSLVGDQLTLSVIGGQTATIAEFEAALQSVTFYSNSDDPSTLDKTISYTFNDGVDNSNTVTKLVQVSAVNDAPVLSVDNSNLMYASGVLAIDPLLTLSDIDSTHLDSARVWFTTGYLPAEDTLVFVDQNGITGSFANGVLTLTGTATVADYQTALASVQYEDIADPVTKGLLSISMSVYDGTSFSNVDTRVVELIDGQNPRAGDDSGTVLEGQSIILDLAANDKDDIGVDLTSITIVSASTNGSIVVNGDGTVTYTHDGTETLSDSFQYTITDGALTSNTGTVNITVTPVNDAPVATNDTASTDEDSVLNVVSPGVLSNDTDIDTAYASTPGSILSFNAANDSDTIWNDDNSTAGFDWSISNFGIDVTHTTAPVTSYPGITSAYQFTGVSGATMQTFQNLPGNPTDSSASFELWFQPNALGGQQMLFETGGTTDGTSIYLDGNNLVFATRDGGAAPDTVTVDLTSLYADPTAEFIQLVGVIDMTGSQIELYVDGTLQGTASLSGIDWAGTGSSGLGMVNGAAAAGSGNFNGDIALFQFYEQALTATEVSANFTAITTTGDTLTVTEVNGNPVSVGSQVTLASGALLTTNADGSYSYDPNGQFENLAAGDSTTDSFNYTVSDGTVTDTATVTITINGVNDAPSGTDGTITVTEDTVYTFTMADFGFSDVDGDAADSVLFTTLPAQGTLLWEGNTFTAGNYVTAWDIGDGRLTYIPPANASGTAYTSFTFQVQDDGGTANGGVNLDPTPNTITIDISAVNDAAIIAGTDTGAVQEDVAVVTNNISTTGTLTITDVDTGEASFVAETVTGTLGDLTIDAAGNWTYTADNTQASIQQLDLGESTTDTLTVTSFDGTTHNVVITINGSDDASVISGTTTGSVTEDGTLTTTGLLSITDTDTSDPTNFVDVATTASDNGYGTFEMTGNSWAFSLNNAHAAVQALDVGETLTDTYTFTAPDGVTQQVTVTINGAEDTPVFDSTASLVATEDTLYTYNITTSDTDVENVSITATTLPTWLTLTDHGDGTATLEGTPLNADVGNNDVVLKVSDGTLSSNQSYTMVVVNTNDAAIIGGTDTGSVQEDVSVVANNIATTGTLTITDVDTGEASFVAETVTGTLGDLTIDAAGNWTYTADNTQATIQQLDLGESTTDTLTVTSFDGTTHNVVITINGSDDAAVISGTTTGSVTEDGTLTSTGALTITDTDTSDPTNFVDVATTASDNGYGTFEMTGNSWTFSLNNAHAAVQALDVGETLTDTYTFTAPDGVTQQVTVTINGAEDTPVFDSTASLVATEDTLYTYNITTSDTDVENVTITATTLPTWLTLTDHGDGTATLEGTPLNADVGNNNVVLNVSDGTLSSNQSFTMVVVNTNDAPVATNDSLLDGAEDSTSAILNANILSNDSDLDGDAISITAINATALTGGVQSIAVTNGTVNIDASDNITFTVDANYNGAVSFDYTISDGALTSTATVSGTISAVNDAAVLTNGTNASYAEGGGVNPFLASTLTDIDSTDFDGGVMTFSIASGGDGSDTLRLAIMNGVSVSGNDVYVDAVLVGTQSGGTAGTDYTISLNSDATQTRVERLFQNLMILNSSDNPTTGVRNLEVTVTDGDGGTSNTAIATADLNSVVNDDPFNAGTLPTDITVTEDVLSNLDLSVIGFSDPDANSGELTVTLATSTGGQLTLTSSAGITLGGTATSATVTGTLANLNSYFNTTSNLQYLHATSHLNGDNADTLSVSIVDNGNTGTGGGGSISLGTVNIDITAVNDVPVATGNTVSTDEDVPLVIGATDFLFTDVESDALTSVTITGLSLNGGTLTHSAGAVTVTNGMTITAAELADLTFTSALNDSTDSSFTYTVNDAGLGVTSAVMNITVNAVDNIPPTAVNQSTTVSEEATNVVLNTTDLSSTDLDTNDATLIYTVGNVTNGSMSINGSAWAAGTNDTFTQQDIIDGNVLYTHDGTNTSSDSFSYSVSDPTGNTLAGQTFSITVTAVDDDAPTAVNQSTTVAEGSTNVVLSTTDLSSTDLDTNDATLIYTVANVTNGSLSINGSAWAAGTNDTFTQQDIIDGNVLYSHDGSNTSSDSFSYSVADPTGNTLAGQTFSITVTAVDDDAPTAVNQSTTVAEGATNVVLTTTDLSSTDLDTADATLIYTVANVTNGSLSINGSAWAAGTNETFTQQDIIDGNVLYSHDGTNTISDSFMYSVADPIGNTLAAQTFSITVTAVDDDEPTAVNQSTTVSEGATNVVLSTTDLSSTDVDTVDATLIYTVSNVTNGSLTINGSAWAAGTNDTFTQQDIIDGNVLYSHDGTNTTSDSFTYSVADPTGNTLAGQTFSITVTAVDDDAPTAVNQSTTVAEGSTNVVLNTTDLSSTDLDTNDATLIYTVGNVTNGSLSINGSAWVAGTNDTFSQQDIIDGNVLYSHDGTNTTSDSFSYSVADPTGNTLEAQSFSITVTAVDDDAPTLVNQSTTVAEGATNITLTTTDISSTDLDTVDTTLIYTVSDVTNGSLSINGSAWAASTNDTFTQQDIIDGNVLYSHDGSNTTSDSFSYSVSDPTGNTLAGQTFSITVTTVDDDAPTAVNQSTTVAEGSTNVVLNTTDLSSTDLDTNDVTLIYTVGNVTNGSLSINGSAWAAGTNDTFTQQDIIDGNVLYSHDGTNTTSDSFSYTVEDPTGNMLAGQTFSITVTAVDDDAPTAVNQSTTVSEGVTNVVLNTTDLSSTDVDTADTSLIYTVANVTNGSLSINGSAWAASTNDTFTQQDIIDGNVLYSHDGSNTTSDSFSYSVSDPTGNTLSGQTFSITVTTVDDDTPTAVNQSTTVAEGSTNVVLNTTDLSSTDLDTNDVTLIYTVGNVTNGSLSINGSAWAVGTNETFTQQDIIDGNVLYSHDGSNTTSDSFTYSVADPAGNTLAGQTFSITVTAVDDDAPTAVNQSVTVAEGATNVVLTTTDLSSTDLDTDDATLIYTVANVTNGSLSINGSAWAAGTNETFTQQDIINGNVLYSHDGTNTTSDSFSYTVEDPTGNMLAGQTFSITVTAVDDDAPTAVNQSTTVSEGVTNVVLNTTDLSSTDVDTADTSLIYTVANVTNGFLSINGSAWAAGTNETFTQQNIIDGNVLYSHDGSNTTSDSFTYSVADPTGNTLAGQTFSITVTAVDDDAPTAVNQSKTVAEGATNVALTTTDLSSTDLDTDDTTLIYTVANVTNGSLSINGSAWAAGTNETFTQQDIIDGNVLYSHDGSNTTSDSFSYSVADPASNTLAGQTFSITVTAVDDDAPTAVNQSKTVAEGATNVALSTTDLSSTDLDTDDAVLIYTVANVTNGSLSINGSAWAAGTNETFTQQNIIDGNVLYSHDGTNTSSDSFTYSVADPAGNTLAGQTFSITVTAVDDDAPTAVSQSKTVAEGATNVALSTTDLSSTDLDTDDAVLIYTVANVTNGSLSINGSAWAAGTNDTFTQQNIIDGNVLYSHDDSNTTSDSFTYSVADPAGNTLAAQTFSITVTAVDDDAPTAVNQSTTVAEGATNVALTTSGLSSTDLDTNDATLIYTVANVTNGSLSINGSAWAAGTNDTFTQQNIIDGNVLYSHDDSNTTSDSFTYSVADPAGNTLAAQTFSITVTAVDDDAPTAVNQSTTVSEGVTNVVLNTTDLSSTDVDTADTSLIYTVANVTNGSLSINGSAWAASTNDTFTQQNIIDGNVLYSHDGSNTTSDSFTYFVADPAGNTLAAQTFSITVTAVDDDAPTAVNQSTTISEGATNVVLNTTDLSSTDVDTADTSLIYTVANVTNGSLSINGSAWAAGTNDTFTQQNIIDGNVLYSHDGTNTTDDSFSYTVADPTGNTLAGQTFSITVTAVDDDVPTAVNQSVTVAEGDTNVALTTTDLSSTDTDTNDTTLIYIVGNVTNGSLTINGSAWAAGTNETFTQQDIINGNVLYSHDGTNTTSDSFSYTVEDPTGNMLAGQTFSITVTAVDDDAPTAVNQSTTVSEGVTNVVLNTTDLSSTDVDTADTSLIYTVANVTNGSLSINGSAWAASTNDTFTQQNIIDGNVLYSHDGSNTTSDSFTYSVADPAGNTLAAQTFSITVTAVDDDAPTAVNQSTTVSEGATNVVLNTTDLSSTDVDTADTSLIYTVANVTNGSLSINGSAWAAGTNDTFTQQNIIDGNVLYSHDGTNTTNDSFSYTVADPTGNTLAGQTFSITVTAVDDDVPTAVNQSVTVAEGDTNVALTTTDLSSTDTDTNDTTLIYTVGNVTNGSLTINGSAWAAGTNETFTQQDIINGNVLYSHDGTNTTSDSFSYTVADPTGNTLSGQTFSIMVTAVDDDVPTAVNQSVTVAEGDTNVALTTTDLSSTDTDTNDTTLIYTVGNVANGSLTINGSAWAAGTNETFTQQDIINGNVLYSHDGTNTTNDSFSYTVADPTGNTLSGQAFSITVTAVNDAPTTTPVILVAVAEDSGVRVITQTELLANAGDVDGDALTATGLTISAGLGALVDNGNGTWSYTPALNDDTSVSFSYTVTDGSLTASGTASLDITPLNDTPTTTPVTLTAIAEDSGVRVITQAELLANAGDVDGDALTATGLTISAGLGALVDNGDGTWNYTPALNDDTSVSFSYTVTDGSLTAAGTASLDITPLNDTPTTTPVTLTAIAEDSGVRVITQAELLVNAGDVDGDALTATGLTISAGLGALVDNGDGTWNYTPALNDDTSVSFSYTITDGIAAPIAASASLDITTVNDTPTALNDTPSAVDEGGTAIFDLAINDFDVDNTLDLNSIAIISAPANGSLIVNGDGTVTYTHDGSETVADSFSYTIADISGAISNTASVTITVNPLNDAPSAVDDALAVNEGNTINIDLAANDVDVDNALDLNSIVIVAAPVNGSLIVNGDGSVDYTHNGSETGSDSFTYTITDISGVISNVATVNIVVNSVNDMPTTAGITDITVLEDAVASSTISLNTAFADADNADSELTYTITGNTSIGLFDSAAVNAATGELVLDYAANMNGSSQISIRASDPSGASVDTLFTVSVTPVNDTPVVTTNTGLVTTGAGSTTISNAQLNVNDVDNTNAEIIYTITELPANGELIINGVVATIGSGFSEDDLINNNVSYQSGGTGVNDQFGFTVSDGGGGSSTGNSFNIVVQLAAVPAEEPVEPEVTIEPEKPEEQATSKVLITPVTRLAPTVEEGFKPIGGSSTPQQQQPELTLEPVVEQEAVENTEEIVESYEAEEEIEVSKVDFTTARSYADVQIKSIAALWMAIDEMKQEMSDNVTENISEIEFRAAAISSLGVVLTAGVVAWVLRSGALMASLISTIPLWKGYDPLPLLVYKNDEEKEIITEDKIPTSLEELKKIRALKEKMQQQMKVDRLFGHSGIGE